MGLKISRVLHAGYLFEDGNTRILFDPIFENPFSRNCHAFPDVEFDLDGLSRERFSAVFISHFHDDHCSFESLDLLPRATPIFIYCLHEEIFEGLRELGFTDVRPLRLDQAIRLGGFEITPRRALDADVDSIFHIRAGGVNVLNVVDSWIDPRTLDLLARLAPWDLVLWPFQTMREFDVLSPSRASAAVRELPSEWIEQIQVLAPKAIVPSSCQFRMEEGSWYNRFFFPITYRQFREQVERAVPGVQVVRLDPSQSLLLTDQGVEPGEALTWVRPRGEPGCDYPFDDSPAPSTAVVARMFPALSEDREKRVRDFCQEGILGKYRSLGEPGVYFNRPRWWRLSLFDHRGEGTHFHYRLWRDQIERVDVVPSEALGWLTEIPWARLSGALEDGESLTSLYVRINDAPFDPSMEKELSETDLLEDPLLRVLFNGDFGSYQKAQLRRLRERGRIPPARF